MEEMRKESVKALENEHAQALAQNYLCKHCDDLSRQEQRVIESIIKRAPVSRDTNAEHDDKITFGERLADRIAAFGGSWTFITLFVAVLLGWVILNSFLLSRRGETFDPYPFILLNLVLSMLAALQAPVIMMSQNRQAAKDRLDAAHDYEVNLKAELEIVRLHEKIDELRERQWIELIRLQQEQIGLLRRLCATPSGIEAKRGSPRQGDRELAADNSF